MNKIKFKAALKSTLGIIGEVTILILKALAEPTDPKVLEMRRMNKSLDNISKALSEKKSN